MSSRNMDLLKKMTYSRNMGLSKKKSWRVLLEGKLAVTQTPNNTELLGKDSHLSEEVEKNRDHRKHSASTKGEIGGVMLLVGR